MNPAIDKYLIDGCGRCELGGTPACKVLDWTAELNLLREIVLECGLKEDLKWGVPCYTLKGKNVLLVSAFKEYCCVSFLKGVLLNDPKKLLVQQGANTQAGRLFKVAEIQNVIDHSDYLKALILESIELEKAGKKVEMKKNPEPIPEELEEVFESDQGLKDAFEALTPGRQRGYILHFSAPKQSATRLSRIEKCREQILNGEGMQDAYKARKKN